MRDCNWGTLSTRDPPCNKRHVANRHCLKFTTCESLLKHGAKVYKYEEAPMCSKWNHAVAWKDQRQQLNWSDCQTRHLICFPANPHQTTRINLDLLPRCSTTSNRESAFVCIILIRWGIALANRNVESCEHLWMLAFFGVALCGTPAMKAQIHRSKRSTGTGRWIGSTAKYGMRFCTFIVRRTPRFCKWSWQHVTGYDVQWERLTCLEKIGHVWTSMEVVWTYPFCFATWNLEVSGLPCLAHFKLKSQTCHIHKDIFLKISHTTRSGYHDV